MVGEKSKALSSYAFFLVALLDATAVIANDFRSVEWGTSKAEVKASESARLLSEETLQDGRHRLEFGEEMLGQAVRINYVFDSMCAQLTGGSFVFLEAVSQAGYLGIVKAFMDIYGDTVSLIALEGGDVSTWQSASSRITLMHSEYGWRNPELADRPPTSVFYRALDDEFDACGQ